MRFARGSLTGMLTLTLCCASTPQVPPLDRATILSIENGVTTRTQIEEWFGAPTDVEVETSGVVWRYERRFRELERPGPVRRAVCGTLGELPILQLPLFWFRQCEELERRERLELRFSPEDRVIALEFDENLEPYGFGRRLPAGYPVPIPVPRARSSDVASAREN